MAFKLGKFVTTVVKAFDPTGIADLILPDVSKKSGVGIADVKKVLDAFKDNPEVVKMRTDAEVALGQIQLEVVKVQAKSLMGLDTGVEFSFIKGLLGSPRRFAVTVLSGVIGFLGLNSGLRAIWIGGLAADADGLFAILKALGGTLAIVAGAYSAKYFGKNNQ